jgi:hypothetical protein
MLGLYGCATPTGLFASAVLFATIDLPSLLLAFVETAGLPASAVRTWAITELPIYKAKTSSVENMQVRESCVAMVFMFNLVPSPGQNPFSIISAFL